MKLDCKPTTWEDRLTLFVGYLVQHNYKSMTIKCYVSAICAVLQEIKIELHKDQVLLTSLTKACQLRNDRINIQLPIKKSMLTLLLWQLSVAFSTQPYLKHLYRAILSTAYFGLFRIGELTSTAADHQVAARDVHIGINKNKMMFLLRSSKTHTKGSQPQTIKIDSLIRNHSRHQHRNARNSADSCFCPFGVLRAYIERRGGYYSDKEPFFVFSDNSPVSAAHFRSVLKKCLKNSGFNPKYYNTHSLRSGRSVDLYKLGLSVETIKKLGRWSSNSIFKYLQHF